MNSWYCSLTGKEDTMAIRILLRLFLLFLLGVIKIMFGMDWALITGLIIIVSDLESIEKSINRKFKKDCK